MRGKLVMAVAATVALAGCGSTKTITQTNTVLETKTVTVAKHTPSRTRTVTVTRTVTAPAATPVAASSSSASTSSSGSGYHGNGIESLGTITVHAPSKLDWTCNGCATFTVTSGLSGDNAIAISSTSASGSSSVDPGTYPDVQVISTGDWAFRIVPG